MIQAINDFIESLFPIKTKLELIVWCPYCDHNFYAPYDVRDRSQHIEVTCPNCELEFEWVL
jgi:transcription elongation factor Elf1